MAKRLRTKGGEERSGKGIKSARIGGKEEGGGRPFGTPIKMRSALILCKLESQTSKKLIFFGKLLSNAQGKYVEQHI